MVSPTARAALERILSSPPPKPVPGQLTVPTGPRIGSVCTGYGGLDEVVLSLFGGSLAWVADPDRGPSRILAHHHPNTPNHGDITSLDWTTVEPVDVLIGGYPCQPFSVAGMRKGTADERHIWPYIATAINALRPQLCVFENVAGHVRLGLSVVLGDLARLGFDAEWIVVPASGVGAAHQRKRVFILAWPADAGRPGLAGRWTARAVADSRYDPTDAADHGRQRGGQHGTGGPDLRTAVARVAADAKRVPGQQRRHTTPDEAPSRRTSAVDCGCNRAPWDRYAPAIHRWEQVTGRAAPSPVNDRGRLAPVFVEWLMGLDEGHVTAVPGLSRTAQLKALGNGVVPQQAAAALRFLLDRAADQGEGAA